MTFGDISTAAYRIKKGVEVTPVRRSLKMSAECGVDIVYKKDFLLPTGRHVACSSTLACISLIRFCVGASSFKERGGLNALKLLDREGRKNGVIAASAGTFTASST